MEQLSYSVIPDSHGEYERIAPVIDALASSTDVFLFLGDVMNGPDCARLIQLIRGLGDNAITLAGNHEWAYRNALSAGDGPPTAVWRDKIWPGYEAGTLESYGLKRTRDWSDNAARLREAMAERGDLAWLEQLPPYLETAGFVAVHAGPDPAKSWQPQAAELRAADLPAARREHEPAPIFDRHFARVADLPASVDKRPFVTGHAHLDLPAAARIGQRRIRLASNLATGQPLFVWNSCRGDVTSYG